MSQLPATVEFAESFLTAVHLADQYFQERNPAHGQQFARELFDLLYDVVAVFPQAPPLFQPLCRALPGREFRKALFRRQYLAIYEVKPSSIRFVLFRHSSFDPGGGLEKVAAELK